MTRKVYDFIKFVLSFLFFCFCSFLFLFAIGKFYGISPIPELVPPMPMDYAILYLFILSVVSGLGLILFMRCFRSRFYCNRILGKGGNYDD